MTDNAKANDTVKKTITPSIKSQQSNPSQSQARTKTSSNTVGSRILSAFRSNTYSKGDAGVQVKSVPLRNGAISHTYPAIHPSGSDNTANNKKTAVADIFPSVGSKASLFTASEGLSFPPTPTINAPEEKKLLSDSGLGKSIDANEEKPEKPEEVLNRTRQSTKPVNATKLIAGEPPTTSGKALDRLIGIPSETPAKAISTLTGA